IDRATQAGDVDLEAWQAEIQQMFEQEIAIHFAAEAKDLFPAASRFPELQGLIGTLLSDDAALRECFAGAAERRLDVESLGAFGQQLSTHIRREEREL